MSKADNELIYKWLLAAANEKPYYTRAIAALTPVLRPDHTTLSVDKRWRLYWSPGAIENLVNKGFDPISCIEHELGHLLRDHADRCCDRNSFLWNLAGDAEINDELTGMEPGIHPKTFKLPDHEVAEFYYEKILDQQKGKQGKQGQGVCGGGSGVDGVPREDEAPDEEATSVKPHELEPLKEAIASDILHHAKTRGDVPAGVVVWAEARKKRQELDWRDILKTMLRKSTAYVQGAYDFTYMRSNRRQQLENRPTVLQPGQHKPQPDIDVIVDTSGSMHAYGDLVAGVLDCVRRTAQGAVHVVDIDMVAYGRKPLKGWQTVKDLKGGGGTDIRPAFDVCLAPIILVVTDCETPWPDSPPVVHGVTSRVLIVKYGSGEVPPYAKVVTVRGDK